MSLRKCVNGQYLDMSPEEEAALLAYWEEDAARRDAARLAAELAAMRAAAVQVLQAGQLADAATDPEAPQEIKDYVALENELQGTAR